MVRNQKLHNGTTHPITTTTTIPNPVKTGRTTHPMKIINMRGQKLRIVLNEQEWLAFFKRHDVNNDGKLCWEELKSSFSDLDVSWASWTTDRALLKADDDEDGYIDCEKEMEKLIQFAQKHKYTIQ